MLNMPANIETKRCTQCDAQLVKTVSKQVNYIDVVGVSVVSIFIFCFIGLLLFSMGFGRGSWLIIGIGGFIALGLYHMVDFKRTTHWTCPQCGSVEQH